MTAGRATPPPRPRPRLVAILGPTACGKSALALDLAERLGLEIVNCDSRQIYREMEIGTAKPTPAERARVPHHLLDLVTPAERFSAGDFLRAATDCLETLWGAGKRPLLVGGTGFYFDALANGLPILEADSTTRATLERRLVDEGLSALVDDLRRLDPEACARLDLANPRRVVRALEIVLSSGKTLAKAQLRHGALQAEIRTFVVGLPRPALADRIRARVQAMVTAGLAAEAAGLFRNYGPDAPGLQTIGYAEWRERLEQETASETDRVIERIVTHTRQYARRQETWFRKRPGGPILDLAQPGIAPQIIEETALFLRG